MNTFLTQKLNILKKTPKSLVLTYVIIYFLWGLGMNRFGAEMEIARFTFWWQVITCYILYMVPISILLKDYKFFDQYAYGLVAMGILEFLGYWLKTSYVYPDNLLDQLFNPQNFSLGMALFFALYFPTGNWLVSKIHRLVFLKREDN
ncbi:hypothetical protein D1816_12185 [Aquimarina sp. AD10]|uniref:hypothetical protein n=1 Tax=Aquimarina TaxID=290174 RepID=UPI000E4A52C7|nr:MULTISPECIES: hypothetical protein [Aquimarina]AXT61075.1 hypothetical protein D1816_12185 [Aquimarina sp. AD10]RKM92750.1 hypothetical protein D7033_20580 [Aquimarina sp. AD10]